MYGTKLRIEDDGTYFNNPLMPSGTVIHDWRMLTTFSEHKRAIAPYFEKKQQYKVILNYNVEPLGVCI